ncbi:MAG: type I-E CRISPR-associated protein Cas5/CasD [Deltaproteobacteria bacterium]|nr:type I-E CRISPR-associated protein Cas5/CasD [Deltaproteobacteria bacterium]
MEGLILRFDAPLMSFGGVKVDQHNFTDRFPGLSLFAGLVANALGWTHNASKDIEQLQERLIVASRWDIEPELIIDYHTVDLGQIKMCEKGWTTRGEPEHREGGLAARMGTHQRYRHYWANGVLTSAITLTDDRDPDLNALEKALNRPARPLFIGRKTCLPSIPIFLQRSHGRNVISMLASIPRYVCQYRSASEVMSARWPAGIDQKQPGQIKPIYDLRDWRNQWHSGSRMVVEGIIRENS